MKVVLQNLTKKFPGRGRKNPAEVTAVDPGRKADRPAGAFRMRKKHDSESDQRSAEAHGGQDFFRGGGRDASSA